MRRPSAIFDELAVVVVPFPFSERFGVKRRPALVVSSASFNRRHAHRMLAMITTSSTGAWPSDVVLRELSAAGLPKASRVRFKLFTLDLGIVVREIGRLAPTDAQNVRQGLRAAMLY